MTSNRPLTKFKKGSKRASAPSTALKAVVSAALRTLNSTASAMQPTANTPPPNTRLRLRRPMIRLAAPRMMANTTSARLLPAVKRVWMAGIR